MKPLGPLALPCLLALASAGSWLAPPSAAQTPTAEERLKILTSPEDAKKAAREKARPPMEFFRSQVAPFDILPYVKPNHWSTLNLELRSNHRDYEGILQTAPVPLWRMPQAMAYRRDARLVKGQRSRLGLQMMLPEVPRELVLDLLRPDSLLADESWLATLRVLEPHQMLILVLAKESNDAYAHWARFQAMGPPSEDRIGSDDQEQEALLPAGLAARARQAARLVPPADLDHDQPRDLGRHVARRPLQPAAASDARLAPLGGAVDHRRRRGAFVVRPPRQLPRPLPAGRSVERERLCSRGKT